MRNCISPRSGSIEAQEYFFDLLKNVVSASATPSVTCSVQAPGIFLDIDKAIPCGLIIDEAANKFPEVHIQGADRVSDSSRSYSRPRRRLLIGILR